MLSLLSAVHAGPAAASPSPAGVPEIEYPSPLSALPDEPLPFAVKNTFVVSAHLEPSSLLGSSAFLPRAARSCPGSRCAGARGLDGRCEEEDEEERGTSASRSTSAGASSRASASGEADPLASGHDGLAGSPCSTPEGSASGRLGALPEFAYPAPEFSVRNTFIDTAAGRLSSMVDDALAERRIRSCPSSGLGLPGAWVALAEVAARLEADVEEEFVPTPAVSSQRAAEDEDGFMPAPAAFCSRAETEDWDSFVPSPLPRWASVDTFEEPALGCLLQAQAVGEERWAPLSFVPPPPLAPPPAALGEGEARLLPPPPPAPPAMADAARAPVAPDHPLLGSPECPTIGSALHCQGACRPCAHAFTKGCANGVGCQFCHLCEPGELKRRQRERRVQLARQKPLEPRAEVGGSARGRRGGKRA